MQKATLAEARELLAKAGSIAVLTGAGVSAESGVPTFRGAAGLWRQYKPEDLATPEAFARDPKLCWEWYGWRRNTILGVEPNPGHYALAKLENRTKHFTLITQNVDGLHQRAVSQNVLEVHGSIWLLRCTKCGKEWRDFSATLELPPHCTCGGLARPGVVWFGENLNPEIWSKAEQAARTCDVLIVAGTSAVVYPAAGLARLARTVIEINIEPTPLSHSATYSFQGTSGTILPQLIDQGT